MINAIRRPGLRERLLSRAIINWETGCWEWAGAKNRDGYGRIGTDAKSRWTSTHRVAYELIEGPISEGLHLDHLCRNRACCNPAHLEPVTCKENILRGDSPTALNAVKSHCDAGHEFTLSNTYLRSNGHRGCRACNAAAVARYRQRKREAARGAA